MATDPYASAWNRQNSNGDTVWGNPNAPSGQSDTFGEMNPQGSLRDWFAQIGHANRLTNPWVNYVNDNVAPGMQQLFYARPGATTGDKAGFSDWARGLVGDSVNGGSGAAGNWLNFQQFSNTLSSLLNGQASPALTEYYSTLDPQAQARELSRLVGAGASMSMGSLARKAMEAGLMEKYSDYQGRAQSGATENDRGFLDFLQGSGWAQRWLPGYQASGTAPGAAMSGSGSGGGGTGGASKNR